MRLSAAQTTLPSGIRRIPISIPWPMGPVNVYLIEGEPLSLVDTGPNFPGALRELEAGLAAYGRRVEDVQRLVLTHGHIDHVGLASEIVRRSGAEVVALGGLAGWLADQPAAVASERAYIDRLMLRHGVPHAAVARLRRRQRGLDSWDPSVAVTRAVDEGDAIALGSATWRVHARPGHSPFDMLLLDERRGVGFCGDHLLPHISSNPVLTPVGLTPADAGSRALRPRALAAYHGSLRRTLSLDDAVLFPGHGDPIVGHRRLVERRLAGIAERGRRIAALVAERPRTAFDVATALWGPVAAEQPDLTLYEVLGHADLLSDASRLDEVARNGQVVLAGRR